MKVAFLYFADLYPGSTHRGGSVCPARGERIPEVTKKISSAKSKTSAKKRASRSSRPVSKRAKKSASKKTPKSPRKIAKKASKNTPKRTSSKTAKKASKKTTKASRKRGKVKKSPLSRGELTGFRKMLLGKRRDLVGDMSGIEAQALHRNRQDTGGDLSNLPTHMADIGTDNYEQEFTLGLLESERELLDEIDEALQRIENKTFGVCLGTGKSIGKARLKARPWAKFCIDYAKMLEKGLVRRDEDREAEIAGLEESDGEFEDDNGQ